MIRLTNLLFILSFLTVILSGSNQIPAPPQDQPILLKGGFIHTASGDILTNHDLLFENGIITLIEKDIKPTPETEVINISGKHVYPGFVAATSTIGLTEISRVRASVDYAEVGRINPNVRANVSYNPDSELIPVARSNGVLVANIVPRSGLISGQSSLMMLDGWTWENATLQHPTGLHLNWPSMSLDVGPKAEPEEKQLKERREKLKEIDDLFRDAKAYGQTKRNPSKQRSQIPGHDLRLESMISYALSEKPVFVHANEVRQIEAAVHWSNRMGVKIVLVGARDSWRVLDLLTQNQVPVILESIHSLPSRRFEDYDQPYKTPFLLHQAGITFCIAGGGRYGASFQRNLPYHSAMAAAYGLPVKEALKSVTLFPAQILGVEDRLGSLEIGKDATLFIADGDPLDIRTEIIQCFIQGKKIDMSDRHKELYGKYQEKYRQLGIIE